MLRLSVLLAFTASVSLAAPIPVEVTHSGYLLAANDAPVDADPLSFSFSLWDDETDTSSGHRVWPASENTCPLAVKAGYFSVVLGSGCAPGLTTAALPPGATRWLEVKVAAVTLSPRVRITGAPSAALAAVALDAERLGGALPASFHDASLLTGQVPIAALDPVLTSVSATSPIVATPSAHTVALAIPPATTSVDGFLKKEDFQAFSNKLGGVALAVNSGLTGNGTAASPLALAAGASSYIQNGTIAQSASLNITGTAQIGGLTTLGGNLSLGQNQLLGARVENLTAEPACNPSREGYVYFNTVDKRFWGCNGSAFVALEGSTSGGSISTSTKMPVDITATTGMTWTTSDPYGGSYASAGLPSNVADHTNITSSGPWQTYCTQSTVTQGVHWLQVDLGTARTISSFGVSGYPGGSHKPATSFSLQGSNDASAWTSVWTGGPDVWTADTNGTYPPRNTQTVTTPGSYRYYRIWSNSWTNGYMLVCDLSLYELQPGPTSGDAMATGFGYSVDSYWNPGYGGSAMPADRVNITGTATWANTCHQSGTTQGVHWIKVDFLEAKRIRSFGVTGYPGGGYKPTGQFYLQGSNDDGTWTTVWQGDTSLWPADTAGSYPPRNTLNLTTPGTYRWYRIFANDWANSSMLLCDWAMYY